MTASYTTESFAREMDQLRKEVVETIKVLGSKISEITPRVPTPVSHPESLEEMKMTIEKFDEGIKVMESQIEGLKEKRLKYKEEVPERFFLDETTGATSEIPTSSIGPGMTQKPNRPRPLSIEKRRQFLSSKPKSLKDTFLAEPIEEICWNNWKKKRLVLIGENRLVERALSRINTHEIHSIPVVSSSGTGVIGTIDVLDIIHALIHSFDRNANLTLQQNCRRDFMNRSVSSLLSKKTYVISSSSSVFSAVANMMKLNEYRFVVVRRAIPGEVALLTNPETDVVGIFTLSDVMKFLVQNSMLMKNEAIFQKTLSDLGLGRTPPKCVSSKAVVSDSFKELGRLCCDNLAVVDDQGCLVGNLSGRDLKGITRNNCPILNSSNADFLARDLKRPWWTRPISVDINDTLYHVVHQFISLQLHHMYVVDNQGKPIGEVNQRDILNVIWKIFQ